MPLNICQARCSHGGLLRQQQPFSRALELHAMQGEACCGWWSGPANYNMQNFTIKHELQSCCNGV